MGIQDALGISALNFKINKAKLTCSKGTAYGQLRLVLGFQASHFP